MGGPLGHRRPVPVVHIVLVYTLPIDLISLVTTVVWFAAMACLIAWHVWYIRKEDLEA